MKLKTLDVIAAVLLVVGATELGSGGSCTLRPGGRCFRNKIRRNFGAQFRSLRPGGLVGFVPGGFFQGHSASLGTRAGGGSCPLEPNCKGGENSSGSPRRTSEHPHVGVRQDMKILVSGATGYVGSRLVPRLVASGHEVACMVRDGCLVPFSFILEVRWQS